MSQPAVRDFVWIDQHLVPAARAPDVLDALQRGQEVSGQFALHARLEGGDHLFVRDPLGVNKLFLAMGPGGDLRWSNYWIDLAADAASGIWSVPAGHWLRVRPDSAGLDLGAYRRLEFQEAGEPQPQPAAGRIRSRLAAVFRRLRDAVAGRPLYVTLSGGLDSTTVAVWAREWLGPFTAVTFAVARDARHAQADDDLAVATRVARDLGVACEVVEVADNEILDSIDDVLRFGQDWREFNVHCGVVNAAIGRAIGRAHPAGPRPVVLTGDVMNELMADYTAVTLNGREYYTLPRLPPGRLRRHLVQGLDSGDREVGIFTQRGVDAIQPYAMCAGSYAAVPDALVNQADAKAGLVRAIMGTRIPSYVYDRPKVRAQVGGAGTVRGTLAVFAEHGVDAAALAARFAALFGLPVPELGRMIRGGIYRVPTSYQVLQGPPVGASADGTAAAERARSTTGSPS
jgi:asparagine synthetase B (glutamine-hydrolysing)